MHACINVCVEEEGYIMYQKRFLKTSNDGELQMLAGSRFHSVGAAIVKDRSLRVVDDLNPGCSRLIELLDLSERSG